MTARTVGRRETFVAMGTKIPIAKRFRKSQETFANESWWRLDVLVALAKPVIRLATHTDKEPQLPVGTSLGHAERVFGKRLWKGERTPMFENSRKTFIPVVVAFR